MARPTGFEITWNQADLIPFKQGKLTTSLFQAVKRAGSDGLRTMRTFGSRYVRNRKKLKLKRVREGLTPRFPSSGSGMRDLEWSLKVDGSPIPVSDYPSRQLRKGVKTTINVNSPKLIKGAFIATMKNGHTGVFVRAGKERLPINKLFSSTLVDVFHDTKMIPNAFREVQAKMEETYQRLLPIALAKTLK